MVVKVKIGDLELRNTAPHTSEDKNKLELEIVKWTGADSCYSVAYWVEDELSFVGDRPFNVDRGIFWVLAKFGQHILQQTEDREENI